MATNRRRAPDPLLVVEAGYRWVEDEAAWLAGIAEAASPFGVGTGSLTIDMSCLRRISSTVG